jgi:peroxiredoxin
MRTRINAAAAIGCCLLTFLAFAVISEKGEARQAGSVDWIAPDFALLTSDGDTFRLSDHRGKVVLLNFWATWCAPCLKEIPDFVALQEELGERGLLIAGVSLDKGGWDVVQPFVERLSVNYPIMIDDGSAERAYGEIRIMPTSFLINREGIIEVFAPGLLTREELRPILLDMLDGVPIED